jgi:hypothetical protein
MKTLIKFIINLFKQINMTQKEAIQAMREGNKVKHEFFSHKEYLHMQSNQVHSEDGVRWGHISDKRYFIGTCLDDSNPIFNEGWEIYKP